MSVLKIMLENGLVSLEHRLGRIFRTPSGTVFLGAEGSRSVLGEGRSVTCPYKTRLVRANRVFVLEIQRETRRPQP
jgi:hypothetical protein